MFGHCGREKMATAGMNKLSSMAWFSGEDKNDKANIEHDPKA